VLAVTQLLDSPDYRTEAIKTVCMDMNPE